MDVWSILIIVLIVQGVFNLSVLFSSSKTNRAKSIYLSLISLVLIWYLAEFLSIRQTEKVPVNLFYGTRYGSWLLLGPLTYFFFKSVTDIQWKFTWKTSLHLLPFLVFAILIPSFSHESLSDRQIHYGMLAVFDHRPKTVTPFEYLYSTIFYIQFLHLTLYLLLNLQVIRYYTSRLKKEYSNIKNLTWLKLFNTLFLVVLASVTVYLYILFQSDLYSRTLDHIYVVPIGVFIYTISYKLVRQEWLPIYESKRYQSSNLKEDEKLAYLQSLKELMKNEKPHLNNELRLKELADLMQLTPHHLSQLINERFHFSFFDFINKYRVEEAEETIKKFPKKNLLQVAFDSGFNNKTSFVNAFKKFKKITPSEYRKQSVNS